MTAKLIVADGMLKFLPFCSPKHRGARMQVRTYRGRWSNAPLGHRGVKTVHGDSTSITAERSIINVTVCFQ